MSGHHHGPERVEVVGDDLPAVAAREARAGRELVHRWWAAGLVAALGIGLVAVAQVSAEADRRDDDDVARLAGRSGFTASLREPLRELWRADGRLVGAGSGVVVLEERSTTPSRLVARHAGTGEVRWATSWAPPQDVARCEATAGPLLCEVVGSGYGSPNTDEVLGEVPGVLLVVDPADGGVLAARELDGRTVGWAVLEDDAVVARRSGTRLEVSRLDVPSHAVGPSGGTAPTAATGRDGDAPDGPGRGVPDAAVLRPVWSTDVALPEGVTASQLTVRAAHGAVVVEGRVGTALDGGDGRVLVAPERTGAPERPVRAIVSPAGVLVSSAPGTSTWTGRRRAGEPPTVLPGRPVEPAPDDGSAPEVVLLERERRLVAVDAASGAVLWERPEAPWRQVARRAEAVLVVEPGGLAWVDARTGAEIWRRPSAAGAERRSPGPGSFVLDARRVLVAGALTGGPPAVIELDRGVETGVAPRSLEGRLRPGTGAAAVVAVTERGVAVWGRELG